MYTELSACRICKGRNLHKFLSLGHMPLANNFLHEDKLPERELYFPLDVFYCDTCGMVQLGIVVDPEIMFSDYIYLTGSSEPLKAHFANLADEAVHNFDVQVGSFIIDIGSNDGTLLHSFKELGMCVLGIEPASNISELAMQRGIETMNDFFNVNLASTIREERGQAGVITATNVFAHLNDLEGFISGINVLLAEGGILVIEVPYIVDMLDKLEFDTIYHEHLSYFALRPLVNFFSRFGFVIVDVKRVNIHGGSIRIYIQKGDRNLPSSVSDLIRLEEELKLDSLDIYQQFARDVMQLKKDLLFLLTSIKSQGATIVGYGAPAKGNILLNYCTIGPAILDYIIDTTAFKHGCYTPGTRIPIFPESRFHDLQPDYALLLAWNYSDSILEREKVYRQAGGKFILPLPKPTVI